MTNNRKKIISYSIKIAVLIISAYFIYYKINQNKNLSNFISVVHHLDPAQTILILSSIFLLMLFNWIVESVKWQYLINKVETISFSKAIQSVFCGLTWAVFTPNRIGEYGGRIFFLKPRKRIQGMVAMSVGHVAQMVVTNVVGALSSVWFIKNFTPLPNKLLIVYYLGVITFCLAFLIIYFNVKILITIFRKIKFLKSYTKYLNVLNKYSKRELLHVLILSIARYVIFTTQYLIALKFLIPQIPLMPSAFLVFILFLVQSALPSLDLLDIGVRSLTSTFFFQYITTDEITVMTVSALIWLVNLIIPAILGTFFIFKLNFFGNNNSS